MSVSGYNQMIKGRVVQQKWGSLKKELYQIQQIAFYNDL